MALSANEMTAMAAVQVSDREGRSKAVSVGDMGRPFITSGSATFPKATYMGWSENYVELLGDGSTKSRWVPSPVLFFNTGTPDAPVVVRVKANDVKSFIGYQATLEPTALVVGQPYSSKPHDSEFSVVYGGQAAKKRPIVLATA